MKEVKNPAAQKLISSKSSPKPVNLTKSRQTPTEVSVDLIEKRWHTTKDYSVFKHIVGNRKLNPLHIQRLRESIDKQLLFTIIIVNETFHIIDGHHRFEVFKALGLPINYIIMDGYGLEQVHLYNQTNSTWKNTDYLDGFCDLAAKYPGKYDDYLTFRDFKNEYKLPYRVCTYLLRNTVSAHKSDGFYTGDFKVKDLVRAKENAEHLMTIAQYYSGYKRSMFVRAFLKVRRVDGFDVERFLKNLEKRPFDMVHCASMPQYVEVIEKIYNSGRNADKLNLRF